ncbi:hypothetical protein OHF24_23905, partial [Escherichia coli]|nr:hypothetical protein [Escherichia coli]
MSIIECEIELDVINDSLAEFKCGNTLHSFIQISQKENVTVIIDDGYVLGTFDCCVCCLLYTSPSPRDSHDNLVC